MQLKTPAIPCSSLRHVEPPIGRVLRPEQGRRSHTVVAAASDFFSSISNVDISTVQSAVTQLGVPSGIEQLAPHWGTAAVQDALKSLPNIPSSLPSLPGAEMSEQALQKLQAAANNPAVAAASQQAGDALQSLRNSLPGFQEQSAQVMSQLGSKAAGMVGPMSGAVSESAQAMSQLGSKAAGMVGPAVSESASQLAGLLANTTSGSDADGLQAHWGALAAQDALNSILARTPDLSFLDKIEIPEGINASSISAELGNVWSSLGTAAANAGVTEVDASSAVKAAAGQLQDALQLLNNLPQSADVTQLRQDLQSLLAGLPLSYTGSWLPTGGNAAEQLAVSNEAAARLTQTIADVIQSGQYAGHDLLTLSLAAAGTFLSVALSASAPGANANAQDEEGSAERELGYEYDPARIEEYFSRRPLLVMKRAAMVAAECAAFGVSLLTDMAQGKLYTNDKERSVQLRYAIERLGPAYVKVAQALSTRVDLLTPEYFMQIQLLQDRVPPFPTTVARQVMVQAFGRPVEQVFSAVSEQPVAAASLGQVYRATLVPELGGGDVAVKVQRPGVLQAVALDLYLMRNAAQALAPNMRSDWVGIIDAWATRFLHEMDYEREAANADRFAKDMAGIKGILVPEPLREQGLTNHNVLTTRWVEGEKLCESKAADVRQLCNTLLSAYLVTLLDTGFLHADPHPGNLLRTPDGRIAVLDYGLMTEVTEEQRWALLEYIAHLSTRDWPALARDLQTLGFIPPEVDPQQEGLVEPLGRIMSQLVGGGGAAKVNIDKVMADLEALGEQYPFQIPAFFALILRAFSVIEGIALGVDPDYAIVAECFPYLSRRLLADDSPRARAILKDILYGGRQRLDIERLVKLADGFSSYTTDGLTEQKQGQNMQVGGSLGRQLTAATAGVNLQPASSSAAPSTVAASSQAASPATPSIRPAVQQSQPVVDPAVKDALLLIFGRQGSYVQELLVEEAAAAIDALSWSATSALLMSMIRGSGTQNNGPAGMLDNTASPPPSPFPSLIPLPLPFQLLPSPLTFLPAEATSRLQQSIQLSESDREALAVVSGIQQLLAKASMMAAASSAPSTPQGSPNVPVGSSSVSWVRSLGLEMAPLLPQLTPGIGLTIRRLNAALLARAQKRLQNLASGITDFSALSSSSNAGQAGSNAVQVGNAAQADMQPALSTSNSVTSKKSSAADGITMTPMQGTSASQYKQKQQRKDPGSWNIDQLLGGGARVQATASSTWSR